MKITFINTAKTLELFYNGKSYSILKDSFDYLRVVQAISERDEELLENVLNKTTREFETEKFLVKNPGLHWDKETDTITWNDTLVHGTMFDRMIENETLGLPTDGIFKFIERVMKSGNQVLISDLYTFLEHGKLPITPDGTFYAYKVVRGDYLDKHSGTMDNSVGSIVEIDREKVDPDRNQTCSSGLHFCSFEYLRSFYSHGDRIVKVEVAPEDVVAIPTDYNNTKARACKYLVVEDVTERVHPGEEETDILRVNGKNITDIVDKEQIRQAVLTLRKVSEHLSNSNDDYHQHIVDAIDEVDHELSHNLDLNEEEENGESTGDDEWVYTFKVEFNAPDSW